jgi:hypothetical protein
MKTQAEITGAYRTLYHTATWTDGETFLDEWNHLKNDSVLSLSGYVGDQFQMMQRNPLEFAIKWPALTAALMNSYLND